MPLVSVIVPTYNRSGLLTRALSSIAEQSVGDYEAIVVNDGGSDVEDVITSYPFVRYASLPKNFGLPAARNAGLNMAKGEYIAYLDDDDLYYPHHLELLSGRLQGSTARAAYSDAHLITEPGQAPRVFMSRPYDQQRLHECNLFPVCCVMHERSLLEKTGFFDESLDNHEDWDLWLRLAKYTDFVHVPQVTCLVDRTRPTMTSDTDALQVGFELVKRRYQEVYG